MSNTGRRRPPLTAPKRRPKAATGKTKPRAASKGKARRPVRRTARSRNPIIRLFRALLGWVLRLLWAITWRVTAVLILVVGVAVAYVYTTLPEYQALMDGRARGSVTLLDREGEVFAWRGDQFGGVVTADTVSPYLKNAVIATEDRRFYMHPGIDPIGIASAMRINLSEGRGPLSGQTTNVPARTSSRRLQLCAPSSSFTNGSPGSGQRFVSTVRSWPASLRQAWPRCDPS